MVHVAHVVHVFLSGLSNYGELAGSLISVKLFLPPRSDVFLFHLCRDSIYEGANYTGLTVLCCLLSNLDII